MKKTGIINSGIASAVSRMGHGDRLVIADAGLPIPKGPERIDLALERDVPGLLTVLEVVLSELYVELVKLSSDIQEASPDFLKQLQGVLGETPMEFLEHEVFKEESRQAVAIVRTGEYTPYANVLLVAGPWGFLEEQG